MQGGHYTERVDSDDLVRGFFPESNIGGFSHVDGTIAFFTQISAILRPTDHVLDFGAGRGEPLLDDRVDYRRRLSNLQGRCAHLEGCDIDDAVLRNPFLDHAEVIRAGDPLPYADETFDLVIARWVFEHIENVEWLAPELLRVVKRGGLIAAVTPNKFGYIALAARLVPSRLHVSALNSIQPDRKPEDVFPTHYRLNTPAVLRKAFGHQADVFTKRSSSEPAYDFGRPSVFRAMKWLDKHLPEAFQPVLFAYVRKR
jgi:SAM-dependent methyltransferase